MQKEPLTPVQALALYKAARAREEKAESAFAVASKERSAARRAREDATALMDATNDHKRPNAGIERRRSRPPRMIG